MVEAEAAAAEEEELCQDMGLDLPSLPNPLMGLVEAEEAEAEEAAVEEVCQLPRDMAAPNPVVLSNAVAYPARSVKTCPEMFATTFLDSSAIM